MTISTFFSKFNLHKADIDVNVTIVAKHDYMDILIPVQFTQSIHCCINPNVAKHDYVNNLIQD